MTKHERPPIDLLAPRLAYTVDEVTSLLGVCRKTIERMVARGDLKSSKRFGRVLVLADSVNELLGREAG